jgi:hypothetical protein
MDELFVALLGAIAEVIFEVFLEAGTEVVVALVLRTSKGLLRGLIRLGPILATTGFAIPGFTFGALSVLVLPHPVFHPNRFHGISLILSPLATGLIMSQVGRRRRRRGKITVPMESFGYGYAFALAMSLVRFFFAV